MFEGKEEQQRKVLNRLKRARGQLEAVITAVEEGAPCKNVITQLSATTSALNRAGFAIVSTAMKECVVEDSGVGAGAGTGTGADSGAGAGVDAGPDEDGSGADARDGDALTMDELEKLFMMLA